MDSAARCPRQTGKLPDLGWKKADVIQIRGRGPPRRAPCFPCMGNFFLTEKLLVCYMVGVGKRERRGRALRDVQVFSGNQPFVVGKEVAAGHNKLSLA